MAFGATILLKGGWQSAATFLAFFGGVGSLLTYISLLVTGERRQSGLEMRARDRSTPPASAQPAELSPATSRRRKVVARSVAGTAATLACVALLSACGHGVAFDPAGDTGHYDSPVAATRDFITDGIVNNNGRLACGYLTSEQQGAASKRGDGGGCAQAFDTAKLTLGREHVNTVTKVRHLKAQDKVSGTRAAVQLSHAGSSVEFRLVKLSAAAQEPQFQAPDTEWRIEAGGVPFVFADPHRPCPPDSVPCAWPR